MQSQWRVGPSGAAGLDYAGVRAYLDEVGLCDADRREAFRGICAAEQATLQAWFEQRSKKASA